MAKLASIKAKDLVRAIVKIGFYKHHQVGSHATFKHADGRRVTIPLHNRELKKGLLHGILKDIELTNITREALKPVIVKMRHFPERMFERDSNTLVHVSVIAHHNGSYQVIIRSDYDFVADVLVGDRGVTINSSNPKVVEEFKSQGPLVRILAAGEFIDGVGGFVMGHAPKPEDFNKSRGSLVLGFG